MRALDARVWGMSKAYRPWLPKQSHLLPVSPLDWLPDDHLAYFVLEVVEQLDLGDIEAAIQAKDSRGTRPYSPRMMTALLLYAYCVGIFSSRKVARATYEDVPMRVIAGSEHPHFTTVNGFRLEHREALARLFQQVLGLCRRSGLVSLGHVARIRTTCGLPSRSTTTPKASTTPSPQAETMTTA